MSDHVGIVMSESGGDENVGVAVEFLFVVVIQAEITYIYADFKALATYWPP